MNINCECYTCEFNAEGKCENGDITITKDGSCADSDSVKEEQYNPDEDDDEEEAVIIECPKSDCRWNENNYCFRDQIKRDEEDTLTFSKPKGSSDYHCDNYEPDNESE